MHKFSIFLGKGVNYLSKKFNRAGSTWPGHIALKLNSDFVSSVIKKNPNLKIILVAGTNGKTTTAKLIQEVLENQKYKVFRNEAGANLLNGVASTLIKHINLNGKISYDVAIFEVDENSLPIVLSEIKAHAIILLNLFRDQLDRYGEVNLIAKKWQEAIFKIPKQTAVIVNGDDPMLTFIGKNSGPDVSYFGLAEKYMKVGVAPHDVDFLFCPKCQTKLEYKKRSYSHMGIFNCPNCGFRHEKTKTYKNLPNPLLGDYNMYNINATALVLEKTFGISTKIIENSLKNFSPAFGRQEKINYNNKNILLLLSKNPTGFNQSIRAILDKEKIPNVMLLLNDRVPDGKDISWIWDVEFEELKNAKQITVSGDRAYDMGLRIKYADIIQNSDFIIQNLNDALDNALSKLDPNGTLYILATYSAMLDIRKLLKGRSIL